MDWTYAKAKAAQQILSHDLDNLGAALRRFPKAGAMGLTPDWVKFSPEYREAKAAFDTAFERLRDFNAAFTKAFKAEIQAERAAKRAATAMIAPTTAPTQPVA